MVPSILFLWIPVVCLFIGRSFADPTPSTTAPPAVLAPLPLKSLVGSSSPFDPTALKWDSVAQHLKANEGQSSVDFSFHFTNTSTNAVTIRSTQTSCGCTVTRLPKTPWIINPGESGEIGGTMNLAGKSGTVTKSITVLLNGGSSLLMVTVDIPAPSTEKMREGNRQRNLAVAGADRQAIFRGDCASCHVAPTVGKKGRELYNTACGICHDAVHKASMVPALRELNHPVDYDYWLTWIQNGKINSLMPAFDLKQGGILDQAQMESIAEFLDGPEFIKRTIRSSLPLVPSTK